VGKQDREEGEEGHHITRKTMNTSTGTDEAGGGRKPRRSKAVGDDVDEELADSSIDSLRVCVGEDQGRTTELEVPSA
jgi:hypothetical protein